MRDFEGTGPGSLHLRRAAARSLSAVLLIFTAGARAPALADGPPILFVSRQLAPQPVPVRRETAVERALSGRLLVLETNGQARALVEAGVAGAPLDVMDPDVYYDATRAVFAGFSGAEGAWRIYEIGLDGTGLRQITRSDRQIDLSRYGSAADRFESYDDVDPCYLPDGRICFVSTRHPVVAPEERVRGTNLYVVNADGSALHRITTERFGADAPAVDPITGRIVYSRWWRTARFQLGVNQANGGEILPGSPQYGGVVPGSTGNLRQDFVVQGIFEEAFPGVNNWVLTSIRSDGTDIAMFAGVRIDRELTQAYRPSFLPDGSALALFIPQTPFLGLPRGSGLRRFARGPGAPDLIDGPQAFPSHRNNPAGSVYASAAPLSDGRIVVSAASSGTTPDYDLYERREGPGLNLLYRLPGSWELDAVPVVPRPLPPVIRDEPAPRLVEEAPQSVTEAISQGGTFIFKSENVHFNAPVDVPIANAPPIGKRLAIEFFTSPQRTGVDKPDAPLLIHREEIRPDGRLEVELPAGAPLFEVLRLPDGAVPVARDGQIFHVGGMNYNRAGQTARCVGCHAGHSMVAVPEDASWTNLATSARTSSTPPVQPRNAWEPVLFQPSALVDRRTDRFWSAGASKPERAEVELRWTVPIRAREVVVYGPALRAAGEGGPGLPSREQVVRAFTVVTLLDGQPRQEIRVPAAAHPAGTRVALDSAPEFDMLRIRIDGADVEGSFEGRQGPTLAEVEVIAQVAGDAAPRVSFTRGDTDCDGNVNITDAIVLLNALFLNGPRLCCASAADTNVDARIDLTDGIIIADYLFLGRAGPRPPFPDCGRVPEGSFSCGIETCP